MSSRTGSSIVARRKKAPSAAKLDFLAGGGEMGERMRSLDWSQTPLGPSGEWPQSLKTLVRVMLDSRYAMWMLWGPELTFFCNDAYLPTLGLKRDWALGARSDKVWEEIWPDIGPRITQVLEQGRATWDEELLLFLERSGFPEETYHTFSYSPVYDDTNRIAGMLCVVTEVTEKVVGERRLRVLRDLAARTVHGIGVEETCRAACEVLGQYAFSVPFAAIYLLDQDANGAHRVALTPGLTDDIAPPTLHEATSTWPLRELLTSQQPRHVTDLPSLGLKVPAHPWPEPVRQALVLPLKASGSERLVGFLIAGVSPRRRLPEERYRSFFDLVASQLAAAIADAQATEAERQRAAALAEIDRAKTAFFSNVSHEFRTPLTLMLGPVEEAAAHPSTAPTVRKQLELAHRNSLRLLRLVNSLLDFSRIEAGRVQASYEPADLAVLTRDLASSFQSAMDRAGLSFSVECDELGEPVYVDPQMWEKIVLNLLSNAFKYTLQGSVAVRLRRHAGCASLQVIDSGVGISEQEVPRLFERFHRVEGVQGRTQEGSGIGLALVQELVKLHGGSISARSELGRGTAFEVTLPLGWAHLPPERINAARAASSTAVGAQAFVQEALRWIPSATQETPAPIASRTESGTATDKRFAATAGARVLIADDNADMRSYMRDLLAPAYAVETVPDGERALQAARREPPDLILSDIMMPKVDGLALLQAVRGEEALRDIPVILLSARAGEESRVEGLTSGADDYLVKPFAARELQARVGSLLELTRMRRENEKALRQAHAELQESEARLREENRVQEVMGRLNQSLVAAQLDLERVVQIATDAATELSGAAFGAFFYTVNDERGESLGLYTLAGAPREAFERFPQPRNTEVFGPTFHGEAVVRSDDITTDPRYGHNAPYYGMPEGHLPVRSYLAVPVKAASGEVLGGLFFGHPNPGVFNDRAERLVLALAAQAAVAFENARLHRTTRLAEEALSETDRRKDEFLAMLAHELRNPLAPIGNASEALARMLSGDERVQSVVGMIKRQATQLTRLVDDLLDVSRITQGRIQLSLQSIDLSTVIAQAVETVEPLLREKRHTLSVTSSSYEQLYVDGDFARLVQCVGNILTNAAKYTQPLGEIRVQTRTEEGTAIIEISDNGAGISAQLLPHVFDLFVQSDRTLDRAQGGLGVGLAVVKRLAQMHGGRATARSAGEGQGSSFEIRLPRIARPVHQSLRTEAPHTSRRRVLIVDDNDDAGQSLALLLGLQGHATQVTGGAREALDRIEAFRPDVALLDLGLPGMDGYELAKAIRALPGFSKLQLIAVSGYGQAEDRRRTRQAGFDDHLVKPVDLAVLERALAAV